MNTWMLYGCTGYSGKLIIKEALKRGHRPILAGRNGIQLASMAEKFSLPYTVFSLDDHSKIVQELSKVDVVLNLAGPYINTCEVFIRACLVTGAHYLDLCNEIYALKKIFNYQVMAQNRGITIIPDVGFNTVSADCLAKYISDKIDNPYKIDICIDALNKPSPGTIKGCVDVFTKGGLTIKNKKLTAIPYGSGSKKLELPGQIVYASPTPMGDLLTILKSTDIPEITVYLPSHPVVIEVLKLIGPVLMRLVASKSGKEVIFYLTDKFIKGPDDLLLNTKRALVWGSVSNSQGEHFEAFIETPEAYLFTSMSAVRAVERVLDDSFPGVHTPSQAFGCDFIKDFESVKRTDLSYNEKIWI